MPECILTSPEISWKHWAKQFAAVKGRSRHIVIFHPNPNHNQILTAYRKTAKKAKGGTLRLTLTHLQIHAEGRFSKMDKVLVEVNGNSFVYGFE